MRNLLPSRPASTVALFFCGLLPLAACGQGRELPPAGATQAQCNDVKDAAAQGRGPAVASTEGVYCLPAEPPGGQWNLDTPPEFTLASDVPGDAYPYRSDTPTNKFKPVTSLAQLIQLRPWYYIYSWQAFTALNWPVSSSGSRRLSVADAGTPQWTNWRESYELFGNDPEFQPSWSAERRLQQREGLPPVDQIPLEAMKDRRVRLLYDSKQAQTEGVLWDQNGDKVYYEVLVNESYFSFVLKQKLYTVDGQIAFAKQGLGAFFEYGSCTKSPRVGTMTLKFAWKILGDDDDPGRYLAMDAYVATADQQWVPRRVGLVGMHISQKTLTSNNRWIWSTFEQVDNVTVDDAEVVAYAGKGKSLRPSFTNVDCPDCPVNVAPAPDEVGVQRTQVRRLIEIPEAVRQVNEQVRRVLHDAVPDAPWRYYQLVGTQFSTVPGADPTPADAGLPSSVTNRGGGQPDPTYLTNTTLETYSQAGNQRLKELVPGTSPANENTLVFGTQSCMGCHVAAGLAVERGADGKVVRQPGWSDYNYQLEEAR